MMQVVSQGHPLPLKYPFLTKTRALLEETKGISASTKRDWTPLPIDFRLDLQANDFYHSTSIQSKQSFVWRDWPFLAALAGLNFQVQI